MYEQKLFRTKLVNGKEVIVGAVWKWGPGLQPQTAKPINKQVARR